MLQVQTVEPVSPSRLQPRCPRDLVTICLKCLEKSRASAMSVRSTWPRTFAAFWTGRRSGPGPSARCASAEVDAAAACGGGAHRTADTHSPSRRGDGEWFWWQAERGLKKAEDSPGKERAAQAERVATLDRYRIASRTANGWQTILARAEELLDSCSDEQRLEWEWRYLDRLRHSALQTWSGHTDGIRALAVHPAGRQVVSAGRDRHTARVGPRDRDQSRLDSSGQSGIMAVAYSRDGRMLATCDSQRRVKLIDPKTGESRMITYGGEGEVGVSTLAFDPVEPLPGDRQPQDGPDLGHARPANVPRVGGPRQRDHEDCIRSHRPHPGDDFARDQALAMGVGFDQADEYLERPLGRIPPTWPTARTGSGWCPAVATA